MTHSDRRLIEDFLPIEPISAEASREKSIRKGHISTLHLWWARRPLVACRAAVYGALVPASRFMPQNGPDNKKQSLGMANAAKFVERLCKYPGDPAVIAEAQRHILEAHAERLTRETVHEVSVEDIEEGRAPRPKVLDMFAGGGAIPLEALRLGCDAYALDLNPVAHIIELCTLVYPQRYGRPDPAARGMTGPKDEEGRTTWGGLANEVRYWGEWVLRKVKADIGDLYPLIPDPDYNGERPALQTEIWGAADKEDIPPGYLVPVAYLWTRTVRCKNPSCGATVPLLKQTWLCRKKAGKKTAGRYVALKVLAPEDEDRVRFQVVEAANKKDLGFDPTAFSKAGNATCPFCGTVADIEYVKDEGWAGRMGKQMMAIVCTRPGNRGKVYLSADDHRNLLPDDEAIGKRTDELCKRSGLTVPSEPIANLHPDCRDNTLGITVRPYGIRTWSDLFTRRQMLCLLAFAAAVREAHGELTRRGCHGEHATGVLTCLAVLVDRLADYDSTGCVWEVTGEFIAHTFGRQVVTMVWDFVELAPFGDASGSPRGALDWVIGVIESEAGAGGPAIVQRGTASTISWPDASFDAVVTDPPIMTMSLMQTSATSSTCGSSER
jgi:putative DNA methylase